MFGKICIVLLVQLVCGTLADEDVACANVTCLAPPKHYEELGCEPQKIDDECCASR